MTFLRMSVAVVMDHAARWIAGQHVYLSTSCQHGNHRYCASPTGSNGDTEWVKTPGACKFCGAACRCWCHKAR